MWHKYLLVHSEESITACLSGDLKTEQFGYYLSLLVHCSLRALAFWSRSFLFGLSCFLTDQHMLFTDKCECDHVCYTSQLMREECVLTFLWLCYTGFFMTVIAHLNPPHLLFGVWGIMALEFIVFLRNCGFFFNHAKGCFLSSWNMKKLDSVYDEQILTKRFWNLEKHINPADLPYFLPLCPWLLFL